MHNHLLAQSLRRNKKTKQQPSVHSSPRQCQLSHILSNKHKYTQTLRFICPIVQIWYQMIWVFNSERQIKKSHIGSALTTTEFYYYQEQGVHNYLYRARKFTNPNDQWPINTDKTPAYLEFCCCYSFMFPFEILTFVKFFKSMNITVTAVLM